MHEPKKFGRAIAEAASQTDQNVAVPDADCLHSDKDGSSKQEDNYPQNKIEAMAKALEAFARVASKIGEEHNCSVIFQRPRIGRKRTSAEYEFWKKPVMAFIETPDMLDLGPTALARRYASTELNFTVTKDTFRAVLSSPARAAAGKLLKARGYCLKLPTDFSIRDVQKAMKDYRDRSAGVEGYKVSIEIIGDTVYCNKKSYKMQLTGSGKMRIWTPKGYIPVDALVALLSGPA